MQTWHGNLSVQLKSKLGRLISTAFRIVPRTVLPTVTVRKICAQGGI